MSRLRVAYAHEYKDRHGRLRRYVRRPGFRQVPLPGLPGSTEFMEAYRAALDGAEPAPRIEVGASRSQPGTVAAAVAGYLGSTAFANLATGTQAYRRQLLDRFRAEHGDKRIATLEHKHVDGLIAARASTPGAATNLLIALRALMRHAVMCGLRSTGGHHSA